MTLSLFPHPESERARRTRLYRGVISDADYERKRYTVLLDDPKRSMPNCQWAASLMSGLIGLRSNYMPTVGTRVLVLYDGTPYIISTMDSGLPDTINGRGESITGQLDFIAELDLPESTAASYAGSTMPADLLPGELDLGIQTGGALQLLYNMARLEAGARTAVELHLLDEMVRIINQKYVHYNALGSMVVENTGGGPSLIWKASSKTHEARGDLEPDTPEAELEGGKIKPESVAEHLRQRFVAYMGYLGDFLNLVICDPDDTVRGHLAQQNSGKSRVHMGADGTLLVQSVSEIIMERVAVLPVPVQHKELDDPEGNLREDIESAVQAGGEQLDELLKRWEWGKNNERMSLLPYQLREYSRFISQLYSWARLLGQDKDFALPSEAESDIPTWDNLAADVSRANAGADTSSYFPIYATWRMFRDGAILFQDGWGSSTLYSQGDIRHSARRDIIQEAGRDFVVVAGRSFFVNARRHAEINALTGKMSLRSRIGFQALCEWGPVWLKSDAPDPADPEYADLRKTKDDQPDPDYDPVPEKAEYGVLIEAARGSGMIRSSRRLALEATGQHLRDSEKEDITNSGGSIVLTSSQDVLMRAQRNSVWSVAGIDGDEATGNMRLTGAGLTANMTERIYLNAVKTLDLNRKLTIREQEIHTLNIIAGSVAAAGGFYGPPNQGDPTGSQTPKPHTNHIRLLEDYSGAQKPEMLQSDELERLKNSKLTRVPSKLFQGALPTWEHFPLKEYMPDGTGEDVLPMRSSAQEHLSLDDSLHTTYGEWDWTHNQLSSGDDRTGAKRPDPWYGRDAAWRYSSSTEPLLHLPSEKKGLELAEVADITTTARIMRYWRKSS